MTPAAPAAVAGVIALTVALVAAMPRVPVVEDEAWFLQVLARHSRGEVLYRDVFYGAGPLPVWIAGSVVPSRRRQMLAVRAMGVVYFVALLVAQTWVLDHAGAGGALIAAVWAGSVAFSAPTLSQESHYTRLALLAAVAGAGTALQAGVDGPAVEFLAAGAWAGLAFSAKQTIGAAAAAATGALSVQAGGIGAGAWTFLGTVVAVAACLAPLARAGTLGWYLRRAFLNKTTYLATGRMGVRAGVQDALLRPFPSRVQKGMYAAVLGATYLILPAVLLACAGAALSLVAGDEQEGHRLVDGATLALGAVVVAAVVPRANLSHVRSVVPVGLATVALAVTAHPSAMDGVPAVARLAGGCVAVVVAALSFAIAVRRLQVAPASEGPVRRDAPYFQGVPLLPDQTLTNPTSGAALRAATGGRVFLLRGDAAQWYLAGGLENPTPYDYPLASVFGPGGQGDVIAAIRDGRVPWVCWPGPTTGRLRPAELEEFVAGSMVAVEQTPAGVLYRMPEPATDRTGAEAPRS